MYQKLSISMILYLIHKKKNNSIIINKNIIQRFICVNTGSIEALHSYIFNETILNIICNSVLIAIFLMYIDVNFKMTLFLEYNCL